ncbi:MAG: aminotransferase class V-fold PLP-dependent enzyme [Ruminococcus sp.]|nr:aminotransferase class V-fold PLP-dependent enzyme [Ruminococcus sp.]MCI5599248.1 aminotransferase class V-fold PLP-dependent enzyme [Ruminococcus sp.]
MIYLDNGATSFPKPLSVRQNVDISLKKFSANPGRSGHSLSLRAAKEIFECRKRLRELFNVNSEEEIIFTENCTMALNTVIFGLLNEGDHVLISSMEHNSVTRPLESLKDKGVTYSTFDYSYDDNETVDNVRNLIKPETKLVICTHASNVFGFRFPIERICALCHAYGILFCVDSAQSAGVFDIDVGTNQYDFVCMSGHKSLYGPMGTGVLILNNRNLKPLLYGGTGTESVRKSQPEGLPEKFESGTQNMNGISGLKAGVDFVKNRGIKNIYNHEYKLAKRLFNGLANNRKVITYNKSFDYGKVAPVVSFNIDGVYSEDLVAKLNKYGIMTRGGLHCSPLAHTTMNTIENGTVRVVPGAFNTINDINYLLNVIRKLTN